MPVVSRLRTRTQQPQGLVRVNPRDQLARGLVAWLPGNGQFYDGSTYARTLTVTGSPAFTGSAPRGARSAIAFDGTDDEISTPLAYLSEFSLSAWVYVDSINGQGNGYNTYIRRGGVFENNSNFAFGVRGTPNSRRVFCFGRNGSTLVGSEVSSPLATDLAWNHIAATWRASALVIYLNGVAISSTTPALGSDGGQVLAFGGLGDTTNSRIAKGPAMDLRVYGRVLSAAEVTRMYAEWQPGSLFKPKRKLAPVVAGAPQTFNPAWARQRAHFIGMGVH